MSSSILKINKMFNSLNKRSRIIIFTEFAKQIQNKKLTNEELHDIIDNLFCLKKSTKVHKLTAYSLFLKENPDKSRQELKLIWREKTQKDKQIWKKRAIFIHDNNIQIKELLYNNHSYWIDDQNIVYDYNTIKEIGYYDSDTKEIQEI